MELRWIIFASLCAVMALFVLGVFKRTKTNRKALLSSEQERALESNHIGSSDPGSLSH